MYLDDVSGVPLCFKHHRLQSAVILHSHNADTVYDSVFSLRP